LLAAGLGLVLAGLPVTHVVNTAAAAAPVSGSTAAEFVIAHNRWRRQVGVGDLSWADWLAQSAQSWAYALQRRNCWPIHSRGADYGENLASVWTHPAPVSETPTTIVDGWGREQRYYDYASDSCYNPDVEEGCGHYIQMVWRATRQVGCGAASCFGADGSETRIWVCHYYPAGNYQGIRPY
jgi:pathogenesis-related protein 1